MRTRTKREWRPVAQQLAVGMLLIIATALTGSCSDDSKPTTVPSITPIGYPIVDTGQADCYDAMQLIAPPAAGEAFYGQDAQFDGNQPSYALSRDGLTICDNVTGLTWTRSPDLNGDGTITDRATDLMWSQDDSGPQVTTENPTGGSGPRSGMNWEDALAWVQQKNDEDYLGYSDWRLPNAKEMQSIVDYSRAPDATGSAAIDPVFNITEIVNEAGQVDYPWFWTGTTHVRSGGSGPAGAYICFGRGMGYMMGGWIDVHGAGCQRSDQKGGGFDDYTHVPDRYYFQNAPQGDAIRVYNYVRLVRDAV